MAVFFGFSPFPGCHGRLQWHHLCLWPDWQWEVIHHAGSCGSFLTERDHSKGIWTHLWEHTGGCEREPVDKFLLERLFWCPIPRSECWWHKKCEWGQVWGALLLLSWGLSIVRWTAPLPHTTLWPWGVDGPKVPCSVEWFQLEWIARGDWMGCWRVVGTQLWEGLRGLPVLCSLPQILCCAVCWKCQVPAESLLPGDLQWGRTRPSRSWHQAEAGGEADSMCFNQML